MKNKLLTLFLMLFLGITTWFVNTGNNKPKLSFIESWIFKENQVGPIVGELGGVPVSIPKPYAHFVEYENDPHFLRQRQGEPPKRTYKSKFRSFGFEFRYPDMAALTDKTRQDKKKSTIQNTMWMNVGVDVAPYHNKLSMQRLAKGMSEDTWGNGQYGYRQLPDTLHGLVVKKVYGYNDAKRDLIPANGAMDSNIYYYVNDQGEVENYIKCPNIRLEAATCGHHFSLKNMKNTQIRVSYRKGFLSQWQKIQQAVTDLILNFSVEKNTTQP